MKAAEPSAGFSRSDFSRSDKIINMLELAKHEFHNYYLQLMKRLITIFAIVCCVAVCKAQSEYVQMTMGLRGGSNCVAGPQLPHGSVNPSPQTPNGGHGGYQEHQPIRGFGP